MRKLFSLLGLMFVVNSAWGQVYYDMSTGNYSEAFTGWASYSSNAGYATNWNGVAILGTGTIPSATKTTTATTATLAALGSGTLIGYDAATSSKLLFLTTGTTDNSAAVACDLNLNFSNRIAGLIQFDVAEIANSSGNRVSSLKVFYSVDGTSWSEITGTNLPFSATNNVAASATISIQLPSGISNQSTVKLRFYSYNGSGGTTGSRPKISIDNLLVTSLAAEPTQQATAASITRVDPNSVNIAWTNGNGANRIVVIKENGAVTYTPTDGTAPSGVNSDFSLATDQGSGNKIVYNGTGSSVSVTGLTTSTPLNIAIYEYNGSGTSVNYLTTAALTLPVSFSSINATNIGKNNKITWSTASEERNRGFDVQRSTDGVNYTSLGFVNSLSSTGNSSSTLNYSFTDFDPIGLKQYYRLKQTDFDGTSRYSGVVVVTNAVPERLAVTSIYPNPTSSFVHLSVASPSIEAMQLIVTDANGRTVRSKYVNAEIGNNSFEVDATGLGAGVYYLSLKGPLTGWQSVGKFVKN